MAIKFEKEYNTQKFIITKQLENKRIEEKNYL